MVTLSAWWIPIGILAAVFVACIVLVWTDEPDSGYFCSLPGERFFFGCLGMIACVVACLGVVALWGWLR
jgi:hypothetical protein